MEINSLDQDINLDSVGAIVPWLYRSFCDPRLGVRSERPSYQFCGALALLGCPAQSLLRKFTQYQPQRTAQTFTFAGHIALQSELESSELLLLWRHRCECRPAGRLRSGFCRPLCFTLTHQRLLRCMRTSLLLTMQAPLLFLIHTCPCRTGLVTNQGAGRFQRVIIKFHQYPSKGQHIFLSIPELCG